MFVGLSDDFVEFLEPVWVGSVDFVVVEWAVGVDFDVWLVPVDGG